MSRKLVSEIERVFKKVAEGIEDFEDCYDKVLNASNASQKEKYETDLKKEIKKLQRLRDQIKTWIQSNEIKDKQDLLHHRKLIEKQMEKFKAIEKEMKTKAYSKEGLLQSTKLDPKEKEKLDLCNWLVDSVDSLSTQIDVLEATAETLEGTMSKKRRDPSKVDKLTQLQERVERHKFHIRRLERIQRLLENESLSAEQVQRIQEDVNYYVDQNSDEEFMEDEYIYDDLPLDEDDALFAIPGEDDAINNDTQYTSDEEELSASKETSAEPEPLSAGRSVLGGSVSGSKSSKVPRAPSVQPSTPTTASAVSSVTIVPHHPTTLPPAPVEPKNAWADVKESVLSPSRPATTTGTTASAHTQPQPPSSALAQPWAAVAGQNTTGSSLSPTTPASADSLVKETKPVAVGITEPSESKTTPSTASALQKKAENELAVAVPSQEQHALANVGRVAAVNGASGTAPVPAIAPARASASPVGTKHPAADEQQAQQPAMQRPKYFTLFQDSEVPDAFADLMATFMKAKHQFSAKNEGVRNLQRQMVDLSLQGIPSLLDQERPKAARKAYVNTPSYYPQTALPVIEHPGMAAHLDLDTLFFAFYYQPNTYQQYLAAKELNRQSWRFHKKYLTWFQRYEEPGDITDDYEQGTYIYFDYEGAWYQRKKSEFRFEYQYLEDTELA